MLIHKKSRPTGRAFLCAAEEARRYPGGGLRLESLSAIEEVPYAHGQRIGQEVREKARLLDRREEIKAQLQAEPLFQEYLMLDFKIRQASNCMARHTTNQLSIFWQSA